MFGDTFYMVVRVYHNNKNNHSIEYFLLSDYDSVDALKQAAKARFHNIIAADLLNENVVYQMAYIMDQAGNYIEKPEIFDRRPKPEPEPEQNAGE